MQLVGVDLKSNHPLSNNSEQKPKNLRDIQLITAKNQHRFILSQKIAPAGVQELTKEEFEQFSLNK